MSCFMRWRKSGRITQRRPRDSRADAIFARWRARCYRYAEFLHSCTLEVTCTSMQLSWARFQRLWGALIEGSTSLVTAGYTQRPRSASARRT
jgi:hypothetical protein